MIPGGGSQSQSPISQKAQERVRKYSTHGAIPTSFEIRNPQAYAPPPPTEGSSAVKSYTRGVPALKNADDAFFMKGSLMLRACSTGDQERVNKLLVESPKLIAFTDYNGCSALHLATCGGHLKLVTWLLEVRGANPNKSDRWGGSPLDDALRENHSSIVAVLRKHGGRPGEVDQGAALIKAASLGDARTIEDLISSDVDVNSEDYEKRTALHSAASAGHMEVVEMLVKGNADINKPDRWGGTAVDDAARHGHAQVVSYLKSHGGENGLRVTDDSMKQNSSTSQANSNLEIDWRELEVVEKIGSGSFGNIFKCNWHGTLVAAKSVITELRDEDREQALDDLKRESNILGQLRHPNICLLLGYCLAPKHELILVEFMKCSLHDLLRTADIKEQTFSLERTLRYATQFAQGMTYLHTFRPPIIHRDLKPPNLLLDFSDVLKVADFGLAKLRPPLHKEITLPPPQDPPPPVQSPPPSPSPQRPVLGVSSTTTPTATLALASPKQLASHTGDGSTAADEQPLFSRFFGILTGREDESPTPTPNEGESAGSPAAAGASPPALDAAAAKSLNREASGGSGTIQRPPLPNGVKTPATPVPKRPPISLKDPNGQKKAAEGASEAPANQGAASQSSGVPEALPAGGAAEAPPAATEEKETDVFIMTGETGAYRFMAPEVYRHEAYNERVDQYSFAMILFNVVKGEPPFAGIDGLRVAEMAATKLSRPQIPRSLDATLANLMRNCWDDSPTSRPPFPEVVEILKQVHMSQFGCTYEELFHKKMRQQGNDTSSGGCCVVS